MKPTVISTLGTPLLRLLQQASTCKANAQSAPATRTFPCKPNRIDGRNCGKEAGRETVVSKVGSEAWASSLLPSNNNTKEKHRLNMKASSTRGRSGIRGEGRKSL
ncbi:rCG62497 [Rattus norvegicus]|uniref:RCG62497 n=1 Tax=Rattus norvegicus TaxID=10116 RepID=A6J5W6_RAT|nr:rCG62497 [Rattus norvegicus]